MIKIGNEKLHLFISETETINHKRINSN